MYILIDTTRMVVIYRCEKVQSLRALAHIELPHHNICIGEETEVLRNFSVPNLQQLFEGLTGGTDPHSHNADYLRNQVIRLCQSCRETVINAFDATVQSLQIKDTDKGFYKYVPGASSAEKRDEPLEHAPLVGNWAAAQALALPGAAVSPPAPAKPAPVAPVAPANPPKYAPPWL